MFAFQVQTKNLFLFRHLFVDPETVFHIPLIYNVEELSKSAVAFIESYKSNYIYLILEYFENTYASQILF